MKKILASACLSAALLTATAYADTITLPLGTVMDLGEHIDVWEGQKSFFGAQMDDWMIRSDFDETIERGIHEAGLFTDSPAATKELAGIVSKAVKSGKVYQLRANTPDAFYQTMVVSIPLSDADLSRAEALGRIANEPPAPMETAAADESSVKAEGKEMPGQEPVDKESETPAVDAKDLMKEEKIPSGAENPMDGQTSSVGMNTVDTRKVYEEKQGVLALEPTDSVLGSVKKDKKKDKEEEKPLRLVDGTELEKLEPGPLYKTLFDKYDGQVYVGEHSGWQEKKSADGSPYRIGHARVGFFSHGYLMPLFVEGIIGKTGDTSVYTLFIGDQKSGEYFAPYIEKAAQGMK